MNCKKETIQSLGLGAFKSVANMHGNNGAVKNQYLIYFENGTVFQSYDSIIAVRMNPKEGENYSRVYIGTDWDYSTTTGKYRNLFLNEDKKETQAKINNGIYKMINS